MTGKGCWLCRWLKQLQLGAHGRGRYLSQAAPHHPAVGADWGAPTDANLTTVPQNCQGFPGEEGDGVGFFLFLLMILLLFVFFSPLLAIPHGLRNLSSPTRGSNLHPPQ